MGKKPRPRASGSGSGGTVWRVRTRGRQQPTLMKEAVMAKEFNAAVLEALELLRAKASPAEEDAGPAPGKSKLIQVDPGKIEENHPGTFA